MIRNGDNTASTHDEIASEVDDYYTNVFAGTLGRAHTIDLDLLNLPTVDLTHLEQPFTTEEVEKIVKNMPLDKAPGPDGFT